MSDIYFIITIRNAVLRDLASVNIVSTGFNQLMK